LARKPAPFHVIDFIDVVGAEGHAMAVRF